MRAIFQILILMMIGSYSWGQSECDYQCSQECRRYAERLNQELNSIYALCGGGGSPGTPVRPNPPRPPQYPPITGSVELFNSDRCTSSSIGFIGPTTDCRVYKGQKAWGVKINGQCEDITDTSADLACEAYRAAGDPNAISIYYSDSCKGSLVGIVNSYSNCALLKGQKAWGIKMGNKCENIADTDASLACDLFKGYRGPNSVKMYYSDSCRGDLVAIVDHRTDCSKLGNVSTAVWGVEINGKCTDISDRPATAACEAYKSAGY